MELLLILLLLILLLTIFGVMIDACDAESDREKSARAGEIRRAGWEARRGMDEVSDDYLRQIHQQVQRVRR